MNRLFAAAVGVAIGLGAYAYLRSESGPTYHNEVSRIVQDNCQTCHRKGGVGPFAFESYSQVYRRRGMIQHVIEDRIMPPWYASPEVGHFKNDRSLSPEEQATLLAWIEGGAPEGDPADAPEPREYAIGWGLGEPDAVVQVPAPFDIPAEGVVDYQYQTVKTDFGEDRWISKMEVLPSNLAVTHHVLVFVDEEGAEGEQGGIDGFFAGWAPGLEGAVFPEGSAKLLPAGATLQFQLHYTPNGTPAVDQTQLGFHFADAPPERIVRTASAFQTRFEIPPHDPNYKTEAEHTFERSGDLLSLIPHMHLRGKAFRFDLIQADGTEIPLLEVPRWDFNWQLTYKFAEPYRVEPGTVLKATAWFDNSEGNEFNPDPTVPVRFGEQTFEEMMVGYFDWLPDPDMGRSTTDGGG